MITDAYLTHIVKMIKFWVQIEEQTGSLAKKTKKQKALILS